MSRSLGVLTLDLIARTGGFEQGMDRASRRVRATAQDMEAAKRVADRYIMAIGAAGVAFASAAAAMAVNAAKSMDATAKMAQQIGTTTEALTGMRFAAQQFANISDQQFDMAMRRMTRRIAEAAEGSGAAKGALEAMGLSARQLAQLAPEKQMLAIADAMHRTERQADRLRYTMAIFDTEGMPLVAALQQGSAAFEQNIEVAKRFGVVLSTEAAQAAERFTSNMSLLNSAQQGFKQQIAESLLPTLADLTDRLVELSERVGPMGEVVTTALKAAGVAALATATIFTSRLIASIAKTAAAWLSATASAARYQMQMTTLASAITGTNRALTASTAALAGSMTVMSRAGQLALGVLGGPVGLLATVGLTATAFLTLGRDARTASVDIDELSESFKTLSAQKLELRMFALEDEVKRLEDQARQSGEILRTMESDALALADAQGVTAEELENVRRSLLEQRDAHATNSAELDRARTLLNQVIDHLERMKNAAHGAAGGVNALNQAMHSEAGEKYLAQLQGQIKALQDGGDPIKMATRWISEHADATDADKAAIMSAAHALKVLQDARNKASRSTSAATKALTEAQRAAQNFRREQDQSLRSQLQSVSAIHSQAQALEDQIAVYGLGKTAIEDLTIARLEERAEMLRWFEGSEEVVEAIEREIEARKRLRTAIGSMEQKEAERQAWEEWARDVEQIFDRVGQSLTDAIFDGGKSAKDLLRDLFKGLTFNVLINPVMQAGQQWVTSQLGGMFGRPQQQGTSFGMPSFGTGTSSFSNMIYNAGEKMGSYALQNFAAGMAGYMPSSAAAGVLSGTLGTSTSAFANTTFSASLSGGGSGAMANAGAMFGKALPYAGALLAASQGQYGSAAGMAIGSYILPGIGTAVGGLIGGLVDGLFGDDKPKTRRAQMAHAELMGDGRMHISTRDSRQSEEVQIAAAKYAEESIKAAQGLFDRMGIDAEFTRFVTLMESSILGDRQGVGSSGTIRIGDLEHEIGLAIESSWTKHGFGGWSDAEMFPRLQTDIQLTLLEAFQVAGDQLPSVLSGMLEGVDIRSLGAEQAQALAQEFAAVVEQVSSLQAALEQLPFANLRDLSFDAAANLIKFAGSLEALESGVTAYFQNFYSREEQLAHQTEQLNRAFGELGFTLPDVASGADAAKAAYRELVESLDLTTEEGQRAYATLMTLSGGFAELVNGMDELAKAAARAAEEANKAALEQLRASEAVYRTEFERLARVGEYQLNAAISQLNAAWSAVQHHAQQEISRLQQTFSVTDAMYRAFLQAGESAKRALQETFSQTDAAYQALSRAAQGLQQELRGILDSLSDSIRDLRGEVEATARMQYAQARAVISTALVTGQLPKTADLTEAMRIAQQGVTAGRYGSAFEQREAYLKLAAELEALQGIAQPELDVATETLEQAKRQYNALRGIEDLSELSLDTLQSQLKTAIATEESARKQIDAIDLQIKQATEQYNALRGIEDLSGLSLDTLQEQLAVAFATEEAARTQIAVIENQLAWAERQYNALMGIDDSITDLSSAMRAFASAVSAMRKAQANTVNRDQRYYEAKLDQLRRENPYYGGIDWTVATVSDLAAVFRKEGMTPQRHYELHGRYEGLSYDKGTSYVPYDMLANIHQGEIIINPRDSDILRRYGIEVRGTGDRALERRMASVEGELIKTNQYLYQITKETKRTAMNTEDTATAVGAHSQSDDVVVVF